MKTLKIEFLPTTSKRVLLLNWGTAIVAILAVVQAIEAGALFSQNQTARAEIEWLNMQSLTQKSRLADVKKVSANFSGMTQVFRATQFPLEDALSALELISMPGVEAHLVDINLQEVTAKAEIEAMSAELIGTYLGKINTDGKTGHWRVEKIQESTGVPLPAGNPGPLPANLLPPSRGLPMLQSSLGAVTATLIWDGASP